MLHAMPPLTVLVPVGSRRGRFCYGSPLRSLKSGSSRGRSASCCSASSGSDARKRRPCC